MGWPIAHSLSPALHNAALAAAGLDYAYIALPVGAVFSIIAIVAAGVYLADVKPALDQVTGRGSGNQSPYGPW